MRTARAWSAAAAFGGKLYVSGGRSDSSEYLNSTEYYDPQTGDWTPFAGFPTARDDHAMVSDGSGLYLLGGDTEGPVLSSVHKINPSERNAEWKQLPSMRETRQVFRVEHLGDRLFAIGGSGRKTTEFFNGTHWEYGPELPHLLWRLSSVVIPSHLALKLS